MLDKEGDLPDLGPRELLAERVSGRWALGDAVVDLRDGLAGDTDASVVSCVWVPEIECARSRAGWRCGTGLDSGCAVATSALPPIDLCASLEDVFARPEGSHFGRLHRRGSGGGHGRMPHRGSRFRLGAGGTRPCRRLSAVGSRARFRLAVQRPRPRCPVEIRVSGEEDQGRSDEKAEQPTSVPAAAAGAASCFRSGRRLCACSRSGSPLCHKTLDLLLCAALAGRRCSGADVLIRSPRTPAQGDRGLGEVSP